MPTPSEIKSGDLLRGDLFEVSRDPQSGVASHKLTRRVAAHQQGFYFVNPAMTDDGRYLWFYALNPPSGNANYGRTLGVADLVEREVRTFPETQFLDVSPQVDLATGEVYWTSELEVWKRGPGAGDRGKRINSFPAQLARNRRPHRIATHLRLSADGSCFGIDAQIGTQWIVGALPIDGSPFELWQEFDRCYNHGQFSPADPDLMMLAQDWWIDPVTGEHKNAQDRLWLIRRGERARPLLPASPSNDRTHEFWSADGRHVWFVDFKQGVLRVDVSSPAPEPEMIWKNEYPIGAIHAHCDASERYVVADFGCYAWDKKDCFVAFHNRTTGKSVKIISNLPEPVLGRGRYHVDPHPHFCGGDRFICYTTTVDHRVDVALVEVAELVAATA